MKYLFSIIILFCSFNSIANNGITKSLYESEKELYALFNALKRSRVKETSLSIHAQIQSVLYNALQDPESFHYPFDSLFFLGKIYSDDNLLRIYTWNVPLPDGTYTYGCIVQQKKGNVLTVFRIRGNAYRPPLDRHVAIDNWYGALYYRAIPVTYRRNTYYTLLGWAGNDDMTNFKMIDVLTFNDRGRARLGLPVFNKNRRAFHRILFEYGDRYFMSLEYNPRKRMIIFDHLAPHLPKFTGIYTHYGPDFSFDAFKLRKRDWIFVEDVDARNEF